MKHALIVATALLSVSCAEPNEAPALSDAHRANATATADLALLSDALESIRRRHGEVDSGLLLNDAASDAALNDAEARLGCRLPLELRSLWQWRNGEQSDLFIWYHRFLPLEAALIERDELLSSTFAVRRGRNWVPVFDFEGEWYAVECSDVAELASPVVHFFIEDDPRIAYANLTTFMQTMAQGMTDGAITWDGSAWRANTRLLSTIHSARNPGIRFPYAVPDGG